MLVVRSGEGLRLLALGASPLAFLCGAVHAETPGVDFGVQSGLTIAAPTSLTAGKTGSPLSGDMTPTDSLWILLAGTGLTFAQGDDGAIAIQKIEKSADTAAVPNSAVKSKNLNLTRTDAAVEPAPSNGETRLEDIIVTARRVAEAAQKTPLATPVRILIFTTLERL